MRRLSFIALLFLSAYGYAQFPMVGSGRQVYRPDQVDSLFYWFDAQDLATITTTNNKVTAWADKGPFGYDVVQADTSKAPTYSTTSGPGGSTAALTFDGADDFLASAAHWWGSDDITVFLVMKFANATRDATEAIVTRSNSAGDKRQWLIYAQANITNPYRLSFGTSSLGTAATFSEWYASTNQKHTNYKTHAFVSDAVDGDWYTDGAEITATADIVTTILNDATNKLGIGCTNTSGTPAAFLQGSISEIIVFSKALTNAERQGIEAYLSSKYDLALQNKQKPPVISNRRIQPDYVDSLFYWFDAMDASSLLDSVGGAVTNDEGVATWADKSGRNWDVTQGTNTARPVYKSTGGPGGNTPAVQFDGTNDFLASAAHFWGSDDLTVFVVMKFGNATRDAFETIITKGIPASADLNFALQYQNTASSYNSIWASYADGTSSNFYRWQDGSKFIDFKLLCHVGDGTTTASYYVDGSSQSYSGSANGTGDGSIFDASSQFSIGARPSGIALLQGSISEIIVFSRALSDSERVGVEQYLKQKWGL